MGWIIHGTDSDNNVYFLNKQEHWTQSEAQIWRWSAEQARKLVNQLNAANQHKEPEERIVAEMETAL